MRLTWNSVRHNRKSLGNVLGYRGMCEDEREDALYIMQRRNNVRNILISSIVWFVLMTLVMTVGIYGDTFKFSVWKMITWMIGNVILVSIAVVSSLKIMKEQSIQWYQPLYLAFWGLVVCETACLMCSATSHFGALLLFVCMVWALGGVPYFTRKERSLFVAVLAAVIARMWFECGFSKQNIVYMVFATLLCYCLSDVRYTSYIRHYKQKRELENALLEAETDPMTGVSNRRGLERNLYTSLPYCVRNELSVATLMIDIDNFKQYNDTYGHCKGDTCIKLVAKEIQKATRRKTDLAARIGGEEFLVFLTGLDEDAALTWAKNLQERIEALNLLHAPGVVGGIVTVSIGIKCTTLQRREDFEQLREQADEELYCAKEHGRACISMNGSCYRSNRMKIAYGGSRFHIRKQA